MRELTLNEIETVGGGEANYQAIGVSIGLTAIALGAVAVSFPIAAGVAALGAIGSDGIALYLEF